jgi:uncharacterized membrane protein
MFERGEDVARVGAFSDGVFAIAITLLILNIGVPDVADDKLGQALRDLLPNLGAYFLSFYVIGMFWMAHHRTFHWIRRVDQNFLMLNLLHLAFVALMPFPTEVLSGYGNTSEGVAVYAGAMVLVGATSIALWTYADRGGLYTSSMPDEVRKHGRMRAIVIPSVFLLSIPIAYLNPTAGECTWILLWPLQTMLGRRFGDLYRETVEDEPADD